MGGRWLPAAGILLAAVLVVSASALPLLPAHKGLERSPLASGASALQGNREEIILPLKPLISFLVGASPSPERAGGAPSTGTSGDQEAPRASTQALDPHSDQPACLGTAGASGRATPGAAPSSVAKPAAQTAPKSQPVSYVAGPEEEILGPGSPEIAAASPWQASPGPRHLGVGPKSSEVPGLSVTVHAPAPAPLRISVTSGPTGQPAGVPPAPTTPAPVSVPPQLPAWPMGRPTFSPKAWKPSTSEAASLQESGASSPGPSYVTRSVTFRITNEAFSEALRSPASLEHQLLSANIRHQLQPIYHEAFSSFEGVGVLLFRPSSVAVNASLVFGGQAPCPSARDILWTLYRKVKAAGQMLGNLSLDDSSLASDGSNLTDLALETVSIRLTVMRPFLPQLLVPGSTLSVLLGKQILQQVTPMVSRFCKMHPLEGPLLLFSNADQWVGIYIEYKFQTPIGTCSQGLANHLARSIMDPTLQKSSIMADGEKAELVLHEVWLQIRDQPFTTALRDKTSPESQELRGMLTRWLTAVLRPLQNFGQVVVEEFQLDPLTTRVSVAFFRAVPPQALVQDRMLRGLHSLQEAAGLLVEMVLPELVPSEPGPPTWNFSAGPALPSQRSVVCEDGDQPQPSSSRSAPSTPSSKASGQPDTSIPSYAVAPIVLGLLLIALTLVLVLKRRSCFGVFSLVALKPCPRSSHAQ